MFIMLDGIDGSGKSTILDTWKDSLSNKGRSIFDLKKFWQTNGQYPELNELMNYDVIISCEPTYTGIGLIIRHELISTNYHYPPQAIAEAFSLDRLILYTKIIIPLIKAGKIIIQDRGISSSLAYQSLQSPTLTFAKLADLSGNRQALEYRPDYLILTKLAAEKAVARLQSRTTKDDAAIFEKIEFLTRLADQYTKPEFLELFTKQGTQIIELPVDQKIDIMKSQAISELHKILNY